MRATDRNSSNDSWAHVLPGVIAFAAVFALAGCTQHAPPPAARADYSQTLNKYYEGRPLCLFPDTIAFPIVDATPERASELGLDALTAAGLVAAKPVDKKGAAKGVAALRTYDLTADGHTALMPDVFKPGAGNFCYGRRKVTSIDSAKRNSSTTELVNYHFGMPQPAAWASVASIQEAFPQVAAEIKGSHAGQATLLDTTDGWEISGDPATIAAPAAALDQRSELAKAKGLLRRLKK